MSEETHPNKKGFVAATREFFSEPTRAALALGVTLVVAVLGALGIQGDLLTRMVRNVPIFVSIAFALVLVGLAIPFFASQASDRTKRWLTGVSAGLVVAGALVTVGVAAFSMTEREQPTLAIAPTWSTEAPGEATLEIKASASSLRTDEDLLLRVIGLKGSGVDIMHLCRTPDWESYLPSRSETVLAWSTSGPAVTGLASVGTSLPVSANQYDYVCAYAALRDRSTNDNADDRWTVSILDLHRATPGSNATLPPVTP